MNTRNILSASNKPPVKHVEFNRDCSYFIATVGDGVSSSPVPLYVSTYPWTDIPNQPILASLLEQTQLVGTVSSDVETLQNSSKLRIWDTVQKREVAVIVVEAPIIGAKLNHSHILIITETKVHLYKHQPSLEKLASFETLGNPMALSSFGKQWAAFPGRTAGHIQVVNLQNMKVNIIPAHASPLRALDLSPNEEFLASASEKGTLIRIHATGSSSRLAELRRGVGNANVYSIAISPSSSRLAVTSDTNTLHIFELPYALADDSEPTSTHCGDNSWESVEHGAASAPLGHFNSQKWGSFARLPFAPRVLTDLYSFASTQFDPGMDNGRGRSAVEGPVFYPRGIAGWIDDSTVVLLSAGSDARYERFALVPGNDGRTACIRVAWAHYMSPS